MKIPDVNNIRLGEKYELETKFSSRKSFYGKAMVAFDRPNGSPGGVGVVVHLYSYGTCVATIDSEGMAISSGEACSKTTKRHINEFMAQSSDLGAIAEELETRGGLDVCRCIPDPDYRRGSVHVTGGGDVKLNAKIDVAIA